MTKPTHTHKTLGGRFVVVVEAPSTGGLPGEVVVVYHDLDKDIRGALGKEVWEERWRPIAGDDCPICLGAGTDQIKGRRDRPCGGCYGLGKVKADGETPADRWQLAEVATRIITGLRSELSVAVRQLEAIHSTPGVNEALEAHLQQAISDSTARQDQEWRKGRGHGPGGRRQTGD